MALYGSESVRFVGFSDISRAQISGTSVALVSLHPVELTQGGFYEPTSSYVDDDSDGCFLWNT